MVAEGWQQWWKIFEQGAQIVNDRLVELAEIKQGDKVLDIATGIGEPAITAAKKVGIKGHVMATDISPQMLNIAKERAASFGLEDIVEFKEIDAEKIDISLQALLQSPSFNAILCRWGLMFLPNLTLTLTNIYKLLSSGGKVAAAVWSEPSKVPKLYAAIDFIAREMGISSTITDNHHNYAKILLRPFNLANIDIVKEALDKAGFKDIHIEYINVIFEFASAEDYTNFAKAIIAPIQDILSNETETRKEEIWKAFAKEIENKYVLVNNNNNNKEYNKSVKMNNETICIVGRKP
jgi:ubiquinone/menaquinone biosynthesis C-methylase UbiE